MTLLAQAQVTIPDYVMLVGYFVLMLGIGVYFYRYMRGMKDYFSGGNTIPWWLSGASFYMSSFSVFAFVYFSALAYKYGWVAVTLYWVTVPATIIISAWRGVLRNTSAPNLARSYRDAPVAIISMAQQASPNESGHGEEERAQLKIQSREVIKTLSSNFPSITPIFFSHGMFSYLYEDYDFIASRSSDFTHSKSPFFQTYARPTTRMAINISPSI